MRPARTQALQISSSTSGSNFTVVLILLQYGALPRVGSGDPPQASTRCPTPIINPAYLPLQASYQGAKKPLMSMITSVGLPARIVMPPLAPAGTIAALAMIVPLGEFRVDTPG